MFNTKLNIKHIIYRNYKKFITDIIRKIIKFRMMTLNTIIVDFNLQELGRFILDKSVINNIIDFIYYVELIQSNILLFSFSMIITALSLYHFSTKQGKELLKKLGKGLVTTAAVTSGYSGAKEIYKDVKGVAESSKKGDTTTSGSGSSNNKGTSSGTTSTK
jgi:hypothetical protein